MTVEDGRLGAAMRGAVVAVVAGHRLTGKMPEWMYRREHPASDPEWDSEPEPDSEAVAGEKGDGHADESGADADGDHEPS